MRTSLKRVADLHSEDERTYLIGHARNLIELDFCREAAEAVLKLGDESRREILHRLQIPMNDPIKTGDTTHLTKAFRKAREKANAKRQLATVWMVDHEAAELSSALLRSSDSPESPEHWEEHEGGEEDHFRRYVEARERAEEQARDEHEEREEADLESERDELATHALARALSCIAWSP